MKAQRQAKILEIVSTHDVETQEQMLTALQDAGFYSTQATISRDIKELRLVKELTQAGRYRYATAAKEVGETFPGRLNKIFKECITSYDYAQNLVVVHTIPGLAGAAASAMDAMELPFVLGTIGGDDTVIIVLRDNSSAVAFCSELRKILS